MTERDSRHAGSRREQRLDRAFRRSLAVICGLSLLIAAVAIWLNLPESAGETKQTAIALPEVRQTPVEQVPVATFRDVTTSSRITFRHVNGAAGEKLLPETMGSGCALIDYDNDGDLDILLVNSCPWPGQASESEVQAATLALYRNDGNWTFVDVTDDAGLAVSLYGMGVAAGDYDGDGDCDLFITAVGPNRLFRNEGGRFTDVTDAARVAGDEAQWSTSCAWLDYNNDGKLDLFVCNYIRWSREIDLSQEFSLDGTSRAYGPPLAFEGAFPYVYRNEGDGTFTDVSETVGVQVTNPATNVPMAKSLGLAPADLDHDGWIDVVVANDTVQNFVFHNVEGQRFEEVGALVGVAFDSMGQARGAMGIDAAAFRNDETVGIAVGNFANEMTALYVSTGDAMQFFDAAIATGLGPPTRLELTFGVCFVDYDLDGRLDLLAANGHLEDSIQKVQESQRYEQPPQLFWNSGGKGEAEFVRVPSEKCGTDLYRPMVGRGVAYGDLDEDGDADVLLTASGQMPRLLRNEQELGHHWIRLRLRGVTCNPDAIGARVEVIADGKSYPRIVMPTRGYLSQSELTVTVGLGNTPAVDQVIVRWPGGGEQIVTAPAIDQLHVIQQTVDGAASAR